MQKPVKLILASESPRRKMLLQEAGFSFHVFSVKVSENMGKNLTTPEQINAGILDIARAKAQAGFDLYKPMKSERFLFLAADTMVLLGLRPLGKPKNADEAREFLGLLSNRTHEVKTAVCFIEGSFDGEKILEKKTVEAIDTTKVTFRLISRQEIEDYVMSGEPMDKAGAYGIQGAAGKFVERIEGAYDNVVGLPMNLVKTLLAQNHWQVK